ncbi:MAG: twin-arginine translocase subunit TatC, partial [Planctomycetia bacterium]
VFQMPLLMLMLERVGVISYEMLAGQRKIAVLVNFIIAATITPGGDPNTMVLLAIPMCLLFELGLLLMRYFRRSDPFAVGDPSEELAEDLF